MIAENAYPALVLNADYRPLGLAPLKTWTWERAVKAAFAERVVVVEDYARVLRSRGSATHAPVEIALPSVIALKEYRRMDRPAAFTRAGLFLRDQHRCAYCGDRFSTAELTFDHVHPQSRGGKTTWLNVVAACAPCNLRKANHLLGECGMALQDPDALFAPTLAEMNAIMAKRGFGQRRLHSSWLPYLGIESARLARVTTGASTSNVFPADMTDDDYWHEPLDA